MAHNLLVNNWWLPTHRRADRREDRRTDRREDRREDRQTETDTNFACVYTGILVLQGIYQA